MIYNLVVLVVFIALANNSLACPYLRAQEGTLTESDIALAAHNLQRRLTTTIGLPVCATRATPVVATKINTCTAYNGVRRDFTAAGFIPDTILGRAKLYGAAVRLAFHDAGEYDKNTNDAFGPDGCLSNSADNAGMIEDTSLVSTLLEPIWQKYCNYISRADFWVMFAQLVLLKSEPTTYIKLPYYFGRKDAVSSCDAGAGRLPDASKGQFAIDQTFTVRLGLNVTETTALIGAHTLGHVHPAVSGYGFPENTSDPFNNAWDLTPDEFDNNFFKSLLTVDWYNGEAPNGKAQWSRRHNTSIMLNTDMVLSYDANTDLGRGTDGQICGPFGLTYGVGIAQQLPPGAPTFGCSPNFPWMPPACSISCIFSNDLCYFLDAFAQAWTKMVNLGYGSTPAVPVDGSTTTGGKFGSLSWVDLRTCYNIAPMPN